MKIMNDFMVRCLSCTLLTLISTTINAAVSETWTDYVAAKNSGATPEIPDFSYAGYKRGEKLPILVESQEKPFFRVENSGTGTAGLPNDEIDDTAAIQQAITDASNNPGGGVVILDAGRYIISNTLRVSTSNVVIRGAGFLAGGTEIYAANQGILVQFKPTSTGNKDTITDVYDDPNKVIDVPRDAFKVKVDDASAMSEEQLVVLYSRDPNTNNDFFYPFTPAGSDTLLKGVEVHEKHTIKEINGNEITFYEPVQYDVKAEYTWQIKKAGNFLSEVGIEDLALVGNFSKDKTFVHHRSTEDDSGWIGVELSHVKDSWVHRVRTVDTNHGVEVKNSVETSLLKLILEGNNGHHGILIATSSRILVGLAEERNIWEHPAGQTGPNSGNVFWRYDAGVVHDIDNHGKYGYATLRDNMSGHNPGNGSGSASQSPRHLGFYTLWNYQYQYKGALSAQSPHNFWASIFSSIVQPIVVGYQAPAGMLIESAVDVASTETPKPSYSTMKINESYGSAVTPESLYEAQLEYRKLTQPSWIQEYKNDWQKISNVRVTIDASLDNAQYLLGIDIELSATVPIEIANDVSKIEFFHGDELLGTAFQAPYGITWQPTMDGTYTVRAQVTLTSNEKGTSAPVNIYVGDIATTALTANIIQANIDPAFDTQPSSHLTDNDLNTYWTSNAAKMKPNTSRKPQSVDFDLGSNKAVNRVDISWHRGDEIVNFFRVHVSTDYVNWIEVLCRESSGNTTGMETYYFDAPEARYVRIIGFTNSATRSTEINEIKLYEELNSTVFTPTQGLSFDGIDDYLELADIDYGSSQRVSVAMWLKFNTPSSNSFVLRKADTSSNNPYYIQISTNGKTSARVNGVNGGGIAGLDDNQWHHFAMTYQGSSSTLRTYKDGVLVATVTNANPPNNNNFLVSVGGSDAGNLQFSGIVDDIRIYDRKLSDSEVSALANSEHLNESAPCSTIVETNLKGFWPLADGGSTTTCDVSGNNNHGTLFNNPTWN